MKKIAALFIVFGFVLVTPVLKLHAQNVFEGTITWTMSIPMLDDDKHDMIVNVKGDKTETDLDMGVQGNVKKYYDPSTKKIYLVMTAMKMGMTMDANDFKTASADSIDIKPTGKKETIAGLSAEEYLIKGKKGDISLWFTADFPKDVQTSLYNSVSNNPSQDANQTKAIQKFLSKGLVPVRMIVKNGDDVVMSMQYVKYERKSIDDSIFVLPADIKFSPMPKGMTGGGTN